MGEGLGKGAKRSLKFARWTAAKQKLPARISTRISRGSKTWRPHREADSSLARDALRLDLRAPMYSPCKAQRLFRPWRQCRPWKPCSSDTLLLQFCVIGQSRTQQNPGLRENRGLGPSRENETVGGGHSTQLESSSCPARTSV